MQVSLNNIVVPWAVITLSAIMHSSFLDVNDKRETNSPWRTDSEDAINCFTFALKYSRQSFTRGEVAAAFKPKERYTAKDIMDAARTLGVPATLRRCTPEQLRNHQGPSIIYFEHHIGSGVFCIAQRFGPQTWLLIDGGTFTISPIRDDELRRHWSGHAVLLADQSAYSLQPSVAYVLIGYLSIRLLLIYRSHTASKSA